MQDTHTTEPKTSYLPDTEFKIHRRESYRRSDSFDELKVATEAILQLMSVKANICNTSPYTSAISDLEYKNHLNTQRNLGAFKAFRSAKVMKSEPKHELLWEYLRATAMCGFILDDPELTVLLHEHLSSSLFQDLISDTLVLALQFDSRRSLGVLFDIQNGKLLYKDSARKRVNLSIVSQDTISPLILAPSSDFPLSNQSFFRYLKFLERRADSIGNMRKILKSFGVFESSREFCENCNKPISFSAGNDFLNLDTTIQIMLMKIAADKNIDCFEIPDDESAYKIDAILNLSRNLSKVTQLVGIRYQDIGRLMRCMNDIKARYDKYSGNKSFEEMFELRIWNGTQGIIRASAAKYLGHIKGADIKACFVLCTGFKNNINFSSYENCKEAKAQISFLTGFCKALIKEKKGFIKASEIVMQMEQSSNDDSYSSDSHSDSDSISCHTR